MAYYLSSYMSICCCGFFFSPVYYCYYFLSTEYDRTRDVGGLLWGRRERAECVRRDDRTSFPSCQDNSLNELFFFLLPLFSFFFFFCYSFYFFMPVCLVLLFFFCILFCSLRPISTWVWNSTSVFLLRPFSLLFFFPLFFPPLHRSPKPLSFFYIKWLASVAILTWSTAVNWTNGVYVLFFSSFPFYHFPRACELLLKWNSFSSSIFHSSRVL